MADEKEKARAQRLQWEENELKEFRRRQPEGKRVVDDRDLYRKGVSGS